MEWLIIILIVVVGLIVYFALKNQKDTNQKSTYIPSQPLIKSGDQIKREEKEYFLSNVLPYSEATINEILNSLNKTKSVETGIYKFETIENTLKSLFKKRPESVNLNIKIQDKIISREEDLFLVNEARIQWMRDTLKEKIDTEIEKANLLMDLKLKKSQIKKALNVALKSIEYFPNDPLFQGKIKMIESLFTQKEV